MIDFDVQSLDRATLEAEALLSPRSFGRRPRVAGYASSGYAGGQYSGYNANWVPMARHADSELSIDLQNTWARSYEQHRNNVMVYGPTEVLAESVGEMMPTLGSDVDPGVATMLLDSWREWAEQAGSDGVSTWSDLCEQIVGSSCQAGDVGVSYENRPELGGVHPLRVNLIDAYRIGSPLDANETRTIRLGVEYSQGVETAYYVAKEDSYTLSREGFYRFERVRNGVPNFSLFRRPDASRRPGQSRGTPITTTILNEVKELGDYRRAMVRGAGKRSRLTSILQSGDPDAVNKYFQRIKQAESSGNFEEAMALRAGLKPNLITTPDASTLNIPNFMTVKDTPTDVTDSGYPTFVTTNLQLVANAWQLPFEVAYQIWQDASYARARILYLRQGTTARRWRVRMTPVATNVWRLHVQNMIARDKTIRLKPNLTRGIMRVDWHGRTQEYMDLRTEVSAEAEARKSGVMSPQSSARRLGRDAISELRESVKYAKKRQEIMKEEEVSEEEMSAAFGPVSEKPAPVPGAGQGATP